MKRTLLAALIYFALVFGAGFALGTIRVPFLEPALGKTLATLCELPFLVAAMVFAARWVARRLRLAGPRAALIGMGLGALALQQMADLVVGVALRGITPAQQVAAFFTPAGALYVTALLVFAAMPLLVDRWYRRRERRQLS